MISDSIVRATWVCVDSIVSSMSMCLCDLESTQWLGIAWK